MTAPAFQAVANAVDGSGPAGSAISPAWPTHQADDIALLIIETASDGNLSKTFGALNSQGSGGGLALATGVKQSPGGTGTAARHTTVNCVHAMRTMALKPSGASPPVVQALGTQVGSTTTASPAWPTHQADDIALLLVESANQAVSLSTASGFVAVASQVGLGTAGDPDATRLSVYWCRATSGSMTAPTIADAGDHVIARIVTFRGCVTTGDPWDVTTTATETTASQDSTCPAVTTTVANTLVCYITTDDFDGSGDITASGSWINSGELGVYLSDPQGFVEVPGSPQATGAAGAADATRISVYWCRATSSSMTAPTVAAHGDHIIARISTYRGCVATGNPWDVTAGAVKATASTSSTMPSVTTTVADTLITLCITNGVDTTGTQILSMVNAGLGSLTERLDQNRNVGSGGGIGVWTGEQASAGSTGTTAVTHSTSSVSAMLTMALTAVASGGGGAAQPRVYAQVIA